MADYKSVLPLVTVVTPSFNQRIFLEETIQSVANQDYPNIEYIVIDGGSTDGSLQVIKAYENNIAHWVSEEDSGQSEAINKGLRRATGQIVTWLNSDDMLYPNAISTAVGHFQANPNVGVVHGAARIFGNGPDRIQVANENDLPWAYFAGMPFSQPAAFFSRTVLDKIGLLDESLHYGLDYDFF